MNRDLHALCTFFRELNIRLTLLTTGLLLQRRAAEVAALFDDVIVSIDGPPASSRCYPPSAWLFRSDPVGSRCGTCSPAGHANHFQKYRAKAQPCIACERPFAA